MDFVSPGGSSLLRCEKARDKQAEQHACDERDGCKAQGRTNGSVHAAHCRANRRSSQWGRSNKCLLWRRTGATLAPVRNKSIEVDGSDLSQRQRDILEYIVATVRGRGYPPSVREIGEAVGLSSPSTVHTHLQSLEQRGYLRRDPTKPRAIEIRWGRQPGAEPEQLRQPEAESDRPQVRYLPIYGSIAAGPTSFAEQTHDGILPFPKDLLADTPHFVLTVRGDSMIEAGILEGDRAVIRAQPDAQNGEIVAAQVVGPTGEAEATIKRFHRSGGKVRLVPANATMEPMEAPADLRILGKVVAILRRL